MSNQEVYESMVQPRGAAYRESQIKPHSHYRDPIDQSPGRLAGNSHVWGDASPEVQSRVVDALIDASKEAGLGTRETAHVLAIARIESGFNPDAAAGTTSAHGLGQFIDRTGAHYGINDANRSDVSVQAAALVAHYQDNAKLASSRGQGDDYIYKYHHDGPSKDYGGLALSQREVMPFVERYEAFVRDHQHGISHGQGSRSVEAASLSPAKNAPASGAAGDDPSRHSVREVQATLNRLGYHDGQGRPLREDGDFGDRTREAVLSFQRAHGLKEDGIVGPRTMGELQRAERQPLLSDASHPDHGMYKDAVAGLENVPGRAGMHNRQELERAAAALVFEAKASGMSRIDHVVSSTNGTGLFAVQGGLSDPAHFRVHVDKAQAASQPVEQSTYQLQADVQQRAAFEPVQQREPRVISI